MLQRTLREVPVLGARSAWSDDEVQIWRYSACRRDTSCGMFGILETAPVDHYNDGHKDYALERRLLCAEPDDEADRRLHHFYRHVGAGFRQPLQSFFRAELHCHCAGRRVSLYRHRERHLSLLHWVRRGFDDWERRRGDFFRRCLSHADKRLVADRRVPSNGWNGADERHSHQLVNRSVYRHGSPHRSRHSM